MRSTQYVGHGRERRCSAFFSSGLATSIAMETRPVEHHVFVYNTFVKSGIAFPVSEICRGTLSLPIFQCVIFSLGVFEIVCLYSQTPYVE